MPRRIYKPFNILWVYYVDGTFDFVKDDPEKVWSRFRVLSKLFLDSPWSGISKVEIRDCADRLIMSVTNHLN